MYTLQHVRVATNYGVGAHRCVGVAADGTVAPCDLIGVPFDCIMAANDCVCVAADHVVAASYGI